MPMTIHDIVRMMIHHCQVLDARATAVQQLVTTWSDQASLLEQSAERHQRISSPGLAEPEKVAARELRNCVRQLQEALSERTVVVGETADASDPHGADTGKLTTRAEPSSSDSENPGGRDVEQL